MNWLRSTVEGAGLAKPGLGSVLGAVTAFAILSGLMVAQIFGVVALGAFVALGVFALELEFLSGLARSRRKQLASLWPELLDSIHSAVSSGMSLVEALDDLSFQGPMRLRGHFAKLTHRLDSGWSLEEGLFELKRSLGEVHADRLCELLLLVSQTGSESLAKTLRQQSQNLRKSISSMAEIHSKQGWISGTAKIAVSAPWVVVALLSTRSENALVYNSVSGATILLIGFLVCIVAYRLVHFLGALPDQPRVFSS